MSMQDLMVVAITSMTPEIEAQMVRTIPDEDWRAASEGAIGLGFEILLRGSTVEVACKLHRKDGCEQLFVVSRNLAPAALA